MPSAVRELRPGKACETKVEAIEGALPAFEKIAASSCPGNPGECVAVDQSARYKSTDSSQALAIEDAMGRLVFAAMLLALVTPAAAQTAERLYLMDCGHNSAKDQARWSPGINVGKPIELSDTCVLIKHGKQWLLWDTGYPDAVADHPVDTPVGHATRDVHSRTGQKCDSQEVALNRKSVSQHLRF